MSDTLSASNALSRNSLLEQIAHPTLVNPLAAQTSAATAAEQVWRVRQQQANQAAGEAYQGAIDAQGNFSPAKFNQNLVEKGPSAALAAQSGVESAQKLTGEQIDQASKMRGQIASMLAPLADPNLTPEQRHAGMVNVANQALDAGMPRQQVLSTLLHVPNDPAGQLAAIEHIRRSLMSPEQLQTTVYGKPITVDNGQQVVGGAQSQQTGGLNIPPGQGVQKQTSPETNAALQRFTVQDPDHPGAYIEVYRPRSALPGASGVAPGGGPAPPTPSGGPPAPRGGAAPPMPPRGGPAIPGAYQPRGAPATPTPATTAPAQSAPATPAQEQVLAAPPQGQPERLAAGNKLYTDANTAIPDQQKRLVAGESALEAMKLAATGPSTGYVAQAKAWLEARGETPDGTDGLSPAAARQVLQKQLLRFADNQSKAAGTDLRLETQIHSNANPDMLASANRHVLLQDIGILRRDMVMNKMMPQGEAALEHAKNFPSDTDPRGFAWDAMTPKERAEVEADAKKSQGGMAKLDRSIELAHRAGLIKVPTGNAK